MKYKKTLLLVILLLPVISVSDVRAVYNVPPEALETGNTAFFLCAVNTSQTLEINLTHSGSGNFTMYLLFNRPIDTNMVGNVILEQDASNEPSISHTVSTTKIYYVQINLVSTGPDIFTLSCSHELTRYYLPQIPGFPLEIIFISLISGFALIFILHKKKVKSI
jgi:hypothetical protein